MKLQAYVNRDYSHLKGQPSCTPKIHHFRVWQLEAVGIWELSQAVSQGCFVDCPT